MTRRVFCVALHATKVILTKQGTIRYSIGIGSSSRPLQRLLPKRRRGARDVVNTEVPPVRFRVAKIDLRPVLRVGPLNTDAF